MKSFNFSTLKRDQIALIIGLVVGLIAVIYYLAIGQGSYDKNSRELKNSDPQVQEVSSIDGQNGEKELQVKCKDGSSYDVYYPPGEKDYSSLASSKCQP